MTADQGAQALVWCESVGGVDRGKVLFGRYVEGIAG